MSVLANFHYQITGPEGATLQTPKLVFLHGVMGFAANWRRIAKAFENEYQVLVYDQRGHGRSFQPASGYGPDDYAGDLKAILDELGWEKVTLVGHSMGGRVAFHFTTIFHERVTRLVVEDIGPALSPIGSSIVIRMLDKVPVPFSSKREAKQWFDTTFMEIFKDERRKEDLAAYLYANLKENDQKQAVWRFSEYGIRESIAQGHTVERWDDIVHLTTPTLILRGELSRDLPREVFQHMLELNPRLCGVEIRGAGHWIHSEQPESFISALQAFFRGETLPNVL